MDTIEDAVFDELRRLADVRGLSLPTLSRAQRLVDELGLRSLDLAHLVASLARRLHIDPFLKHVPITQVRTIGDLCDAYSTAIRHSS